MKLTIREANPEEGYAQTLALLKDSVEKSPFVSGIFGISEEGSPRSHVVITSRMS